MATTASNDFLRFSAYQIKDLITRKLSEDSNFTDQVYEGSNLAILIDIVSYMYQCLIYNLNSAAAESMFSDTQIYENISRLCKFIGYHPTAFKPATINARVAYSSEISSCTLYPCTAIDTGLYDSNSKKIYFSTVFSKMDYEINNDGQMITDQLSTNFTLVNGRWKHYSTVFVASGIDYETFVLDGLKSDSEDDMYVANNGIQVFVIPNGVNSYAQLNGKNDMWYPDPNEIFIQAYDSQADRPTFSKLYSSNDHVYTAYLNENKTFEIKFGNGISGKKLNKGDVVHVMYLDTNGPDGYIDITQMPQTLSGKVMNHSPSFFGIDDDLYQMMFNVSDEDFASFSTISSDNVADHSLAISFYTDSLSRSFPEQNVNDIRETAPNWFKTGNRLITKKDYEFFFKANNQPEVFPGVIDVVCMNNWDYMTTFYRWLYNLGLNPINEVFTSQHNLDKEDYLQRSKDGYRYLSKARLVQAGYMYVDSADANNIYLWIASDNSKNMTAIKANMNESINNIKTMTSETYPQYPVDVYFDLSFTPTQLYYDQLVTYDGNCEFDANNSYLEITISDNSIFSNIVIASKVKNIIENAFSPQQCVLGQIVNYSSMLNAIYDINGVTNVRTVYYPDDYLENTSTYDKYKTRSCDGIAFASWSYTPVISGTRLVDIGDDLEISNTSRTLEKFQFPRLAISTDLSKKIKVIRKSMNSINPVKF